MNDAEKLAKVRALAAGWNGTRPGPGTGFYDGWTEAMRSAGATLLSILDTRPTARTYVNPGLFQGLLVPNPLREHVASTSGKSSAAPSPDAQVDLCRQRIEDAYGLGKSGPGLGGCCGDCGCSGKAAEDE